MPDPSPPVPADVWERIVAFLAAGKTGQIVLHVKEGRVLRAVLQDEVRVL